jgi:CRISPR type IV-associated protein Csf3
MEPTFTPFTLTAHLVQSVSFDTRFGVGLDALLASAIRKKEKAEKGISGRELDGGLAVREVRIVDLPLAKCQCNALWHWEATMATVVDKNNVLSEEEEVGFIIQHADVPAFEQTSNFEAYPPKISEHKGRYRARKTPIVKTLGQSIVWHGIGSPEAVYELLKDIPSIGQRRTSGEGSIRSWEITEERPENPILFSHSIDGEGLSRPSFNECLQAIHQETGKHLEHSQQRVAYRPPYWHFGNIEDMNAPPFRYSA